jgi:hypothetical protein
MSVIHSYIYSDALIRMVRGDVVDAGAIFMIDL